MDIGSNDNDDPFYDILLQKRIKPLKLHTLCSTCVWYPTDWPPIEPNWIEQQQNASILLVRTNWFRATYNIWSLVVNITLHTLYRWWSNRPTFFFDWSRFFSLQNSHLSYFNHYFLRLFFFATQFLVLIFFFIGFTHTILLQNYYTFTFFFSWSKQCVTP